MVTESRIRLNLMADEYSRAVSFANSFFALVDGLASGLENHLADNVILDWFGRTVRGKRNVATFIKTNKVDSRHMFASIKPTDGIGYKKHQPSRKRVLSNSEENGETEEADKIRRNSTNDLEEDRIDSNEISKELKEEENVMMQDMTYVLNEGDLCNLFKLDITKTDIEEIEESINRVKLEEEMVPMVGIVERDHGQQEEEEEEEEGKDWFGLGQIDKEIKYVEAVGKIRFLRKHWRKDMYNKFNTPSLENQRWYRPCKLQIAYSVAKERRGSISSTEGRRRFRSSSRRISFQEGHRKLPSLQEITSLSNRLVPNVNNFGGYLKTFDFYSDRESFLESLKKELAGKEGSSFLTGYMHDKLIFNRPTTDFTDDDTNNNEKKKESANFVFNYQIHVIIYQNEHENHESIPRDYEKHV